MKLQYYRRPISLDLQAVSCGFEASVLAREWFSPGPSTNEVLRFWESLLFNQILRKVGQIAIEVFNLLGSDE